VLADAIDPPYRALVLLGAYCGLRLGEMLALRRSRVVLLHRRVEVVATLYEIGGELIETHRRRRPGSDRYRSPASWSRRSSSTWPRSRAVPTITCFARRSAARCASQHGGTASGHRP
jgi:hypothetical protein